MQTAAILQGLGEAPSRSKASDRSLLVTMDEPVPPWVIGTMFAVTHGIHQSQITPHHTTGIPTMVTETDPNAAYRASQEFTRKAAVLRNLFEELVISAPDAAKEQLLGLKNGIASLCEQGTDCTLSSVTNRVVATVRAHPVQTAAAAIGAGLITWWLLSRRG